jgi:3'(2'), 5'-bisphosphate nucleotidase
LKQAVPLDKTLEDLVALARSAGRAVMAHYKNPRVLSHKSDNSPLTQADLDANRIIVAGLQKMKPRWPIVSEELPIPAPSVRRKWTSFWLVDPVDGTKEFLDRTGHFTINIGLIRGDRPVAGVVFAPALDLIYFGSERSGSWKIEGQFGRQAIYPKLPLPGETVRVLVSRRHDSEAALRRLGHLKNIVCQKVGSSLKFGLMAEGRAHAYTRFGPTSEWDTAAGDAVWRYATADGTANRSSLKYNKPRLKNSAFLIGWYPKNARTKKNKNN